MTAPIVLMPCPSQEALAAFVDGRLSPEEHAEVISHLASCADCRDLVLLAIDFQKSEGGEMANEVVSPVMEKPVTPANEVALPAMEEPVTPANEVALPAMKEPVPPANEVALAAMKESVPPLTVAAMETSVPPPNVVPFGRRILQYSAALAVAAAVVFAFLQYNRPGIDDLVAASAKQDERAFDGRLSGGFGYGTPPVRTRGSDDPNPDLSKYDVTAVAYELAEDRDAHRRGIGLLFVAKELGQGSATFRDQGITALDEALKQKPDDPRRMNDLAVALLDRGAKGDYERALELANRAWSLEPTPEAAWNRALAMDLSHRYADAVQAWDDYLKVDPSSPWAAEARDKRKDAQESLEPLQVNP